WKAPFDIRLQIRDEGLILNDSGGRSIHFEPLFPGEISYSRSESLWLARGGVAAQHSSQPLSALWQVLPEDVRLSPHVYLATNSLQGPWWILSWPERVPGADEVLPPPPPAYRVLTRVVDGFGRTLAFHRAAKGDVAGAVTGVTDGAGRRFHLALTTQAQRAEAFRKQRASSLSSPASPRSVSSSQVFPDTLPAGTEYGADNGIRLEAVWLTHDPAYPDEQPTAPLARYTYTAGGELRAVYDRSGTQVRGFAYDAEHAGRMVAHHYAGRPESRYRYDDTGRVTEQVNPEGLEETWYGWDGDRLTTVQTQQTRIQTVYQPGSFTPLLRIETENGEQAKARHRSLAEVLQEDTGVTLPAELAVMLGRLERELRAGAVSAESEAWLAQCGLTVEQMESQMEAEYIPERRLHLYHCDHRGLPQALISPEGETAWRGEYDEWGNQLNEENPPHLYQPYRLPGQQYDEESGLYYNRHRYYDPLQGRYITQDPIGLKGGINLYTYPLAPIRYTDPLGLERVISVYGPPAPDRAGAETPLVLTDMTGGVTIYYDPETGDSMTFDCSNRIDRRSQRGAGDPYTGEVVGCETNGSGISAAYGTTKIYTTDTRARWLHGGGSSLRDPYAPRQGWKPTMGCTRAQNEDVDELCKKVTSWMYSHPGERIRYERFKTR
ncbi:RHS repeat-associated core domain-containing protein, partial [Escherichia coli]|nr:RHS repeat-associated core domain-containing protein [Escherichia coli]